MLRSVAYRLRKLRPELARWEGREVPVTWLSEDGVLLHGRFLPSDGRFTIVLAHGLLGNHAAPAFQAVARSFARYGTVHAFDLRGHGGSGGSCTLGRAEALDVAAVTAAAAQEDRPVAVVGFSMGAVAAIRSAALYQPPDAVVAVSPPASWGGPRRHGAARTSLIWKVPGGRNILRFMTGVRMEAWEDCESPLDVVHKIAPVPLLIVHGTDDDFFPPSEAEALYEAAEEPKALWMIPSGGHAEGLLGDPGAPPDPARVDAFVDEVMRRLEEVMSWRG